MQYLLKNMFFTITRENGAVYSAFQDLFADIENVNVCTLDDILNNNYEVEKYNKIYREKALKYDFYHYFELYDEETEDSFDILTEIGGELAKRIQNIEDRTETDVEGDIYDYYAYYGVSPEDFVYK